MWICNTKEQFETTPPFCLTRQQPSWLQQILSKYAYKITPKIYHVTSSTKLLLDETWPDTLIVLEHRSIA